MAYRKSPRQQATEKKVTKVVNGASRVIGGGVGLKSGVDLGQSMKEGLGKIAEPDKWVKVGEHKLGPGNINEGTWVDTLQNVNEAAQQVASNGAGVAASILLGSAGLAAGIKYGPKITAAMGRQFKQFLGR